MAAQLLELINLGLNGRLASDPYQHPRTGHFVDRPLRAVRTGVARLERLVRHLDLLGTVIRIGTVAAMALAGCRRVVLRGRFRAGFPGRVRRGVFVIQRPSFRVRRGAGHRRRLLGARAEEYLLQATDCDVLLAHQLGDVGVGLDHRFDRLVVLTIECRLGTPQSLLQFLCAQLDDLWLRPFHGPSNSNRPTRRHRG